MSANKTEVPAWLQRARGHWTNRGGKRPDFAVPPTNAQESVWDYPRPPAVVADRRSVEVRHRDSVLAQTSNAFRVLETSHPPSFYLPPQDVALDKLVVVPGSSHCEWKGQAEYLALAGTDQAIGWRYPSPYPEFADYAAWISFYPDHVDCFVDGEPVQAQLGGFYGGWITSEIVGPFKGQPGTTGW